MSENRKSQIKQSFIRGSLTSSAGVFLSKLIGLFYIVPFRSIVGQANMTYYSVAYDYYTILLQICSAGIPFAVAAMISKYMNKEDYRTVVLVRRLSTLILMVSGFVMALLFMLSSGFLSRHIGLRLLNSWTVCYNYSANLRIFARFYKTVITSGYAPSLR